MSEIKEIQNAINIINDVTWVDNGRHYGKIDKVRDLAIQALTEKQNESNSTGFLRWIKSQYDDNFTQDELADLRMFDRIIYDKLESYLSSKPLGEKLEQDPYKKAQECKEFCNDCDKCETIPLYKEVTK